MPKIKQKICLYCEERPVSLFGKYDEDSNICEKCLEKEIKRMYQNDNKQYSFKL